MMHQRSNCQRLLDHRKSKRIPENIYFCFVELPEVQGGFRKGRGTRDQIADIRWIIEKAREFQKNIYFCFIDYAKPFDCWITTNCGKF